MKTIVVERNNRLFFTAPCQVVQTADQLPDDTAAYGFTDSLMEGANPFVKYIVGDFVESDNPNQNTQFWTAGDLAMSEYSIKYAPLNMLHKQRTPIGFYLATRQIPLNRKPVKVTDESSDGTFKIQALSGMWSHIFPFESAVIDQANDSGNLFYSMECRGTHVHCAGPDGCDQTFEYDAIEDQCEHIRHRTSIRHIVNPIFRGGAIIVPPTRPGWSEARASVLREEAIRDEAALYAEMTEASFEQAQAEGRDITVHAWESLMAQVLLMAEK